MVIWKTWGVEVFVYRGRNGDGDGTGMRVGQKEIRGISSIPGDEVEGCKCVGTLDSLSEHCDRCQ